jgi:LysR family transcriptional regulator, glycine cleavage system transcriptional activator
MSRGLNLNAFVYFEAVARRGTLTRAAEELSVSPSAVSQQVKLLEQQLGVKLFRRDGRVLSLTLEGEQLFQTSNTALRMLRVARDGLGKTHETRRLNLRVTPSFGVRWLGPRLSDFIIRHPDWDLRVDAAPDPTDFDREIMDFDIRYGTGVWTGFHMQPVVQDHVLPLASPAYLASLSGQGIDRLDQARLIDSARAICKWDFWLYRNSIETRANRKTILMDRSTMAIQLALDGVGVVLESLALVADDVVQGRLVPVTPHLPVISFPAYWLLCPQRYLSRRAVRLFLEWITVQAKAHEAQVAAIADTHGLTHEAVDAVTEFIGAGAPDQ